MTNWLNAVLRILFATLVAYPVVLLWLGIHVRHRERLPHKGPAIIAANHNSHLDILALLYLFPLASVPLVRPAAAIDYFFKNRWIKWFSLHVIGIIPVMRGGASDGVDPLEGCYHALEQGQILVIFPEGTRGEPEQLAQLKAGIWHLSKRYPHVPIVPVYLDGLGKSMPKGTLIPVPFFVNVGIGTALFGTGDKGLFLALLRQRLEHLRQKVSTTTQQEPP